MCISVFTKYDTYVKNVSLITLVEEDPSKIIFIGKSAYTEKAGTRPTCSPICFYYVHCCPVQCRLVQAIVDIVAMLETRAVRRLVWPFDGIVQKHIYKRLIRTLKCSFNYPEHKIINMHCQF